MVAKWTILHGEPSFNFNDILFQVFQADNTTQTNGHKFTMKDGNLKVVVEGNGFEYAGPSDTLVDGTVKSIDIYKGGTLVARVTKLSVSGPDFQTAVNNFGSADEALFEIAQSFKGSGDQDRIYDSNVGNKLNSGAGDDFIFGNGGGDTIDGGKGDNFLNGGAGADSFIFASKNAMNRIQNFNDAENDLIKLSKDIFAGIGPKGALDPTLISFAEQADIDDRFFINSAGEFYYDANGSGLGKTKLIGFFIGDEPTDASSFVVIA